jgi:SWIM zinc finger
MTGPGDIVLAMRHVITLELDLSTLRRAIGGGSYVRGAEYARQQAVLHVTWDPEDTVLRGMVRGQGGNVYQTAAFFSLDDGQPAEFETGECSCPLEFNCKHVVALVLSVLEPGSPGPARPESPQPAWSQSLDSVLDHGGAARCGTTPLAIELALTGGAGQPRWGGQAAAQVPLRLIARLVRPGKNGGWVAGDLNWGRLDALGWSRDYSEQQVRLLRELYVLNQASGGRGGYYGYHYGDDRSIEFSSIGSRQLWPLLDEAAAAGLQLVYPGNRGELAGYEEARFCLDVTRGEAGGLQIVPVIRADDGDPSVPVAFIGAEGHGAVCVDHAQAAGAEPRSWRFRLARLALAVAPPLQRMALGGASVAVPAAAEPRFRDWYYPRLRQAAALISSDGSFTPPAICGPDLVLEARYRSGHELELSWEWTYQVGDSALRAQLEAGGPDDGYRDLATERALLAGLDLPLDRYGQLGQATGVSGAAVPALAPRTRLTGIDTMRFSTELLPLLAGHPGLIVEVSGEPADYREAGETLRIAVSTDEVAGDTDWFDLGVTITVEGRPVPFLDVFLALSRGEPYLLPDGAYFCLDKPELRALARLGGDVIGLANDRRVGRAGGDHPPSGQVPPLHLAVAQPGVRRVDQVEVGTLPVPHLPPGIARVRQDRRDRAQRPGRAGTVRVPLGVGGRRARDPGVVQRPGDPGCAVPGQSLGEHPLHDRRGVRVRRQPVRPAATRRVRLVRVRAGVDQPVPVRRSAAQITALLAGLGRHRGPDPDPDPGDLPLGLQP